MNPDNLIDLKMKYLNKIAQRNIKVREYRKKTRQKNMIDHAKAVEIDNLLKQNYGN